MNRQKIALHLQRLANTPQVQALAKSYRAHPDEAIGAVFLSLCKRATRLGRIRSYARFVSSNGFYYFRNEFNAEKQRRFRQEQDL
jgi:hypothetical protein